MSFWNKKIIASSKMELSVEANIQKLKITCPKCKTVYTGLEAMDYLYICPECGKYMPIGAKERLLMVLDKGSFEPWFEGVRTGNPLHTADYEAKIESIQKKSGCSEAVTIGKGRIAGFETVIGVCDPNFMMGSMGQAMGERITLAFEKATQLCLPVIMFCCSGGARMQEGIFSLMQMEKTAAAVKLHSDAGLFYCSVLTDPTMAGVTASFSTLADVILAEPQARIGFAGPRVIQQTIETTLPQGFQTAEFQLKHGFVDRLVERKNLVNELHYLLYAHPLRKKHIKLRTWVPVLNHKLDPDSLDLIKRYDKSPWEKVKICRSSDRVAATDYIENIFTDFRELHGDRYFGDDQALVGGIAFLDGKPITVIADVRGKDISERVRRNFGMPNPEGYRKAIRLMKQAEKFGRPIISFISTSGAFCGIGAEERGQGQAIAQSIMEMSMLRTPTLAIIIGEGGSGGALATAVGNEVWMLEHSTYAILSPEGYSAILWKTKDKAEEASAVMKITAQDLAELGVIDRIIPEYGGATKATAHKISAVMAIAMTEMLKKYEDMTPDEIVADRYSRFRKF